MTNEEIQTKIAQSLGWTVQFNEEKQLYELLTPAGKWEYPFDADGGEEHCWKYAPDYPESLDACAEFESSLIDKEFDAYQIELSRIVFNHPCFVSFPVGFSHRKFWQTTPLQRCLAYIKIKNL